MGLERDGTLELSSSDPGQGTLLNMLCQLVVSV